MSSRGQIRAAAFREWLNYDLGVARQPVAHAGWLLSRGLSLLPSESAQARSGRLAMRLHTAALSPSITQRVTAWVTREVARESQGHKTSLRAACNQAILDSVSRGGQNSDPRRLIASRILVVKAASPRERGVIVVDYQYVFPLFAGLFDVDAIGERYEIVLEPSWAGACTAEILLFSHMRHPVHVETTEPRDHELLKATQSNLQAVPIAANWWVDPRMAPVPGSKRDIDVIMVAAWADIKRHWRVFKALSDLRRRGHRLKTVLVGYRYDRTKQDIEGLAEHFGIRDQVETYERISQEEVSALLARSKVHVLWSRRECANRAIIEAMLADVPVIVRDGLTFGFKYPYVNEQTGAFVPESGLAEAILQMIDTRANYSPRAWVLDHMTCVHATRALESHLSHSAASRGEPWTRGLAVKTSTLDTQRYYNPEDRRQFDDDYAFVEAHIRK